MYFIKLNNQKHVDFIHIAVTRVCFIVLHHTIAPSGPGPAHCQGFKITLRHTTLVGLL
jgi:hypothetical protein